MVDKEGIFTQVERNRDFLVNLTSDLVKFNTADPPGKNTSEAQNWFAGFLRNNGFTTDLFDVFPGEPDLVGIMKGTGGGRSIILNGHIDVAEVRSDENWNHPPFEPIVENDRIWGRGTTDMKGGLAACVAALRSLRDCNIKLRGDVILESVIGEEAGEPGTVRCIERGYKADFALVPEPSEFSIAGQGGVITGWITIKSPQTIHDGARRLCIHAGGGLDGASAIEKMVKIIEVLQNLERHWAVMKSHPMVPVGTTTINPAVIEGGRHPAFIADECRLWITVHYLPNEDYEKVTRDIEQTVLHAAKADPWLKNNLPQFKWGGTSLVKDKGEIFPAANIDPDHIGVKTISQAHRDVTGKPAEVVCSPTVTDAGWFARAGIPVAIYGPGSLRQAHIVNEYVEISDLMVAAKSIALTIYNWCQ
jgi:acetylornithine deacetylase/succinyl-diaminopimelate desuccinylase family protein